MSEKIYISWNEFHQDVKNLCKQIKRSGEYNKIVAISRGGLIPAGIISYELNIRNSAVINISTYVGSEHLKIDKIDNPEFVGKIDKKTLIIDDLSDTGQTFQIMRQQFPSGKYVSVYTKNKGEHEVDIYARKVPDKWLVFPWDID